MEALVNSLETNGGGDTAALSREQLEAELTKTRSCVCCNARLCNLRNLREAIGSGNAADEHPVQQDSAQRGAGSARLAVTQE